MGCRGDQILFQETLKHEPFWFLVACHLVNRAKWIVAERILGEIRERWPTSYWLSVADVDEVGEVVRPLGFQTRRAVLLVRLAEEWQRLYVFEHRRVRTAKEVMRLPGCDEHAADSFAIFVEGRRDVLPMDGALLEYLNRRKVG